MFVLFYFLQNMSAGRTKTAEDRQASHKVSTPLIDYSLYLVELQTRWNADVSDTHFQLINHLLNH